MFDQYVKTRAEEERREKKNKIMQAKEDFKKMMEEAKFNPRYVFTVVTSQCGQLSLSSSVDVRQGDWGNEVRPV